jgi:hypothetical protein
VHFCLQPYALFTLSLSLHFIYLLHLLSTNHRCTQPCYFSLLSKPAAQKEKMDWNFSMMSSGYVLPRLLFLWCYGVFRCSVLLRVILVIKDIIYVIIILYIHDIWLSMDTFTRMCGTIDPGSCIRWIFSFGIKIGYDRDVVPMKSHAELSPWHLVAVKLAHQALTGPWIWWAANRVFWILVQCRSPNLDLMMRSQLSASSGWITSTNIGGCVARKSV